MPFLARTRSYLRACAPRTLRAFGTAAPVRHVVRSGDARATWAAIERQPKRNPGNS